jgi:general stress protein YciG
MDYRPDYRVGGHHVFDGERMKNESANEHEENHAENSATVDACQNVATTPMATGPVTGNQRPETDLSIEPQSRKLRGFATMSPERRRALGRRGGKSAHENGRAHTFNAETARAAGRVPHERGTAHHWTKEEAREAGRKGGNTPKRPRGSDPIQNTSSSPNSAE